MAIDPSIITNATLQQQAQQNEIGNKLAGLTGALGQMVLGRRINQMRQLGTPDEQKAFANNSIFAPQLNQVLKSDQVTAQKNLLDQQKTLAEIGEIEAHALERKANAGDTNQKTLINRQRAISSAIAAAMSGNPKAANFMLEHGKQGGILDDNSYTQAKQFLIENENNPEAISSLVKSLGVAAAEKPEQYIQPDANTVANNATSVANNVRTTNATLTGQRIAADTADKKRIQDKILAEQKLAMERGEFETMTGTDGKAYAVYKDGRVEPLLLKSGEAFTPQPKGTNKETQLQMIKRKESAQNHASASAQAASGATLAANIANRYVQGGYNPAKFALESRIPGTEAYGIAKDLESLKSNAFLSRSDQMRGLGALTETEGARLISSVSPLDPMQSSEKFLSDLKNVAGTFSDIAKSNRDKAQLYANPNSNIANPTIAPAKNTEQNVTIPKGAYMTLSDVKASAKNAGISVKDAIQRLQSKGITIR